VNTASTAVVKHGMMTIMRHSLGLMLVTATVVAQDAPPVTGEGPRTKTLDELLGIEGDGDGSRAAQDDARARLDRDLGEQKLADTFERAIEGMRRSTELLDRSAAAADVARTQEEILSRLDAIIDEASRRQQQQQSSSSSSSSSSSAGRPGQQGRSGQLSSESEQQRRANARNNRPERTGKGRQGAESGEQQTEDAAMEDSLDPGDFLAGEAEWGSLPPRVREQMRQGMRERMSSVYRTWTERYYERVAKESKP